MLSVFTSFNKSAAITKSDTVNFPSGPCDGIWVGGAGTVTVVYQDDTTEQFTAAAGTVIPVRAKRVNSTGTAATGMIALYAV